MHATPLHTGHHVIVLHMDFSALNMNTTLFGRFISDFNVLLRTLYKDSRTALELLDNVLALCTTENEGKVVSECFLVNLFLRFLRLLQKTKIQLQFLVVG